MPPAQPKMPAIPRGCGWTLIVLAVPSLIIGLISIVAIPLVWQRSEEIWTETPAKVTEAFVVRGERKSSSKSGGGATGRSNKRSIAVTFTVMLRYDYTAGGKSHTGTTKCLAQPADDETYALAAAIIETYPAGKTIPVFHHPKHHEKSRLTAQEPRKEFILDVFFGVFFSLCGIVGLLFGRAILRKRGRRGL